VNLPGLDIILKIRDIEARETDNLLAQLQVLK